MIIPDAVRLRLLGVALKIIRSSPRPAMLLHVHRLLLDYAPHLMWTSRFLAIVDADSGRALVLERAGHVRRASRRFPGLIGTAEAHLLEWARLCFEKDRHAAARAARLWISAASGLADVSVKTKAGSPPRIEIHLPGNSVVTAGQRLQFAQTAARTLWGHQEVTDDGVPFKAAAESLILAVTQALYLAGEHDAAMEFISGMLAVRHSWFIEMVHYAMGLVLASKYLPPYILQLLGEDVDYFHDKFCSRPFKEINILPVGNVSICCPHFLPEFVGNVKAQGVSAIVNSKRSIRVRKSILEGKFTYCNWTKCPVIKSGQLPERHAVREPAMQDAIRANDGIIDDPRNLVVAYDSTCNLWCPSCRDKRITEKGHQFDEIMRITNEVVLPILPRLRTLQMNLYGDIFTSRSCRHILNSVDPDRFPDLKLRFTTNGVLFTEQEWEKFPNIHRMVQSIEVSVDATTKPTYDKIRLGGNFEKLSRNLQFIAGLRRSRVITEFKLAFVVQRENFREMRNFVNWGEELGCDLVLFGVVQDWGSFGRSVYDGHAVHLPTHPLYPEYRRLAEQIAARATEEGRQTQIYHEFELG